MFVELFTCSVFTQNTTKMQYTVQITDIKLPLTKSTTRFGCNSRLLQHSNTYDCKKLIVQNPVYCLLILYPW